MGIIKKLEFYLTHEQIIDLSILQHSLLTTLD